MSGKLSGIGRGVKKLASHNLLTRAGLGYIQSSKVPGGRKVKEATADLDTKVMEAMPSPFYKGSGEDTVRALQDSPDLFGEQQQAEERAAADEEAARIAAIPPPKPLPDDEEIDRVRKKNIAKQRARKGRASTILSDDSYGSDGLGN